MPRQASRTTKWKLISTYGPEEYGSVLVRSTPKFAICTAFVLVPIDSTEDNETWIASDLEPYQAHCLLSSYCARLQTAHKTSNDKGGQSDTVSYNSSRLSESRISCQATNCTIWCVMTARNSDECKWTRRGRETDKKTKFENRQRPGCYSLSNENIQTL